MIAISSTAADRIAAETMGINPEWLGYCKYCGAWQVYVSKSDVCKKCGKEQDDPAELAWYCSMCGKFCSMKVGLDSEAAMAPLTGAPTK